MPRMSIELSSEQRAFVDERVRSGALDSRSEYLAFLIQREQLQQHRAAVDMLLLEGLRGGPATPMTAEDWQSIEREGLARLSRKGNDAPKRAKNRRRPKRPA